MLNTDGAGAQPAPFPSYAEFMVVRKGFPGFHFSALP